MKSETVELRRKVEILEAIVQGGTIADIGKRLGTTGGGFYAALQRYGIKYNARADGRLKADIVALGVMAERGFCSADIAPILQRSRQWVQATAKEGKIKLPQRCQGQKPSRRDLLAIVSGRTNEQVARALGVGLATLWSWMKAEGVDMQERKAFAHEHWGRDVLKGIAPELAVMPVTGHTYSRVKKLGASPAAVARYEARVKHAR